MNWNEVVEFALTRKDVQINEDMIFVKDLKFFKNGAVYYCSDRNVLQTLICEHRSLDQIKTMIESITETKYLTEEMKEDLRKMFDEWEVNVEELDSYKHIPATYTWQSETWASPEDSEWDEEEEKQVKKDEIIEELERSTLYTYLRMSEPEEWLDDETEYLKKQAIKFVESL